jgi:hypothetical protein
VANVVARTGLSADHEIALEGDDSTLLKFAKAMFRHEAGRESPLSDNQILHGFKFARDYGRTGRVPAPIGPSDLQSKADNSLLLMPLLMMFLKEKRMADDPAKPQQSVDIENVLLPMLLQSALTGKLIDVTELLSVVLTGKPSALAANTPTPWREPWSVAPQQPTDINALLLPLLYQVLTGKPWPGATPPREPERPEKKPNTPGTSRHVETERSARRRWLRAEHNSAGTRHRWDTLRHGPVPDGTRNACNAPADRHCRDRRHRRLRRPGEYRSQAVERIQATTDIEDHHAHHWKARKPCIDHCTRAAVIGVQ